MAVIEAAQLPKLSPVVLDGPFPPQFSLDQRDYETREMSLVERKEMSLRLHVLTDQVERQKTKSIAPRWAAVFIGLN